MMARQNIKKKYLMRQIPIKILKQHASSNSSLHNLRIYLSKGCTKTSQRCTSLATISHINYWDQVNSWKNLWKFWNGPLCRNKSGSSPYSMLQYIGRVATPKLVSRNCLRYLQTTLIMRGGGLVSELCKVLSKKIGEK